MSRRKSASNVTQPAVEPALSRIVSRASGKGSLSSAGRRQPAQLPARTSSTTSSKVGPEVFDEKSKTRSHTPSQPPSVSKQSQTETPQYWGMPVFTYEPLPEGLDVNTTPLPKAMIPKLSTPQHRAHVVKKYSSTKRHSGIFSVKSGLKVLKGTPSTKIIHARVYLFYKRQGFPDHHIVDLAEPEKSIGSYGFFDNDFARLFDRHFGISDGRARVVYGEKRMPEPWMDVHIDVEVRKEIRNGKEEVCESALGLYKPVVLNSSKMEEMKRNGGKCGAWIAKENERWKRVEEEDLQKWKRSTGKMHWRLPHRSANKAS